ncbi:hypothetical protein HMPREF3038_02078 [Akkermansia sp. KLE1797]|nr:hypothetical protein HMPREF3038_02078 [Akkermansia sp. KLE1797]KXU53590.1 hypothetical protein HMPREF3039_02313 [Akkermansia sp. KLE1798]KZA05785.1 hypothetical protein HMPREF1326_00612 [Akkermansia sp. KLE1605]
MVWIMSLLHTFPAVNIFHDTGPAFRQGKLFTGISVPAALRTELRKAAGFQHFSHCFSGTLIFPIGSKKSEVTT